MRQGGSSRTSCCAERRSNDPTTKELEVDVHE
jgi:hypothetical protein